MQRQTAQSGDILWSEKPLTFLRVMVINMYKTVPISENEDAKDDTTQSNIGNRNAKDKVSASENEKHITIAGLNGVIIAGIYRTLPINTKYLYKLPSWAIFPSHSLNAKTVNQVQIARTIPVVCSCCYWQLEDPSRAVCKYKSIRT